MNLAVEASSTSYRIVAGADMQSADPLALNLDGGNVTIDGHTNVAIVSNSTALIAAPTIVRSGTGSIDIAASGDFALLDPLAPGVVYTAGTPVQPAIGGDNTSVALGLGAVNPNGAGGISTLLTSETNPEMPAISRSPRSATSTGIENVRDTLADQLLVASHRGSTSAAGTFHRPVLGAVAADQSGQSRMYHGMSISAASIRAS